VKVEYPETSKILDMPSISEAKELALSAENKREDEDVRTSADTRLEPGNKVVQSKPTGTKRKSILHSFLHQPLDSEN
jgi:hypothetical protein